MNETSKLNAILSDPAFADNIVCDRLIPARPADYVPFPAEVNPQLKEAFESRGITRIYSHQAEVWQNVHAGHNTVVVTPTASGKTLCYNLPVLNKLLEDESARALYLFPTKALSQDQQSELNEIISSKEQIISSKEQVAGSIVEEKCATCYLLPATSIVTYDGDTPDSLRIAARDTGRIVITNPDMLHAGVLPNHTKWLKFFTNLKYIVIDEIHSYRGVFGSHVANVIRRLQRITEFYGSHPVFIMCSATIGNPKELAEGLIGRPVNLVDKNGAPSSEKRVILYNPPLVDAVQGIRRSVVSESRRWMLAFLQAGIKTILFAHSRIKTEVAASYVNEDLKNINTVGEDGKPKIKVEAYRGGLLPNERHEIERGLREGNIQGVVSTNALELGIDIGGLDASIVAGFPGSFNSFWQQSGRAGRRGGTSVSVFIASSSPLDQFIMQNNEWFFAKSAEEGRIDPENPYIFTDHVKCATFELPFKISSKESRKEEVGRRKCGDSGLFGDNLQDALDYLAEDGIIRKIESRQTPTDDNLPTSYFLLSTYYWSDRSYPAEGISLRSATADNVVIIDVTKGRNAVIGEMDRPSAKEMVFKNAVYLHRGRQFIVENLDIENRKCLVVEADVNYFTDGLVKRDIKVLSEDEEISSRGDAEAQRSDKQCEIVFKVTLGDILVRSQVSKFKKIKFWTHENIGYGDIDLSEEEMQTRALMLTFPPDTKAGQYLQAFERTEDAGAALSGAGTLIKQIAPVYLLCDSRDIGIAERVRDPHFGIPALYIYDKYPGGTGLAEALAEKLNGLFHAAYETVAQCSCKNGCPSCVGPAGGKAEAKGLLRALIV